MLYPLTPSQYQEEKWKRKIEFNHNLYLEPIVICLFMFICLNWIFSAFYILLMEMIQGELFRNISRHNIAHNIVWSEETVM
jgi:hypothetical protein